MIVLSEGKSYGLCATLVGEWSDEVAALLRSNDVRHLELNQAKGWRGANVDFLREVQPLDALTIIDFSIKDVAGIAYQSALKYLDLNTYSRSAVDFSIFQDLEECAIEWNSRCSGISQCGALRRLFINKWPDKNLVAFGALKRLRALSLANPAIESLFGASELEGLDELSISRATKLLSLDGVEKMHKLTSLEVNDCKKIGSISQIAHLLSLRRLMVCNGGNIESLQPLRALKCLREFFFYESTNIVDGDLGVLKELDNLTKVAFMDRRHYSHRRADFAR